jgi:hypothetical protein
LKNIIKKISFFAFLKMANFEELINIYKNGEREVIQMTRFIFERAQLELKIAILYADFTRNWNSLIPQGKIKTPFSSFKKFTDQSEFLRRQHELFHVNLNKLGHEVLQMSKVNYPKTTFGNLEISNTLIEHFKKVNIWFRCFTFGKT